MTSLSKHVTLNCCSFIWLGISLSFSDNSADNSSILIFSNVLSSKVKQFYLQAPTKVKTLLYIHNMISVTPHFECPGTVAAHLKNKCGVWGDLGGAACRSICILWLTDELAQFPNFHCGHPDVPCLYY